MHVHMCFLSTQFTAYYHCRVHFLSEHHLAMHNDNCVMYGLACDLFCFLLYGVRIGATELNSSALQTFGLLLELC